MSGDSGGQLTHDAMLLALSGHIRSSFKFTKAASYRGTVNKFETRRNVIVNLPSRSLASASLIQTAFWRLDGLWCPPHEALGGALSTPPPGFRNLLTQTTSLHGILPRHARL